MCPFFVVHKAFYSLCNFWQSLRQLQYSWWWIECKDPCHLKKVKSVKCSFRWRGPIHTQCLDLQSRMAGALDKNVTLSHADWHTKKNHNTLRRVKQHRMHAEQYRVFVAVGGCDVLICVYVADHELWSTLTLLLFWHLALRESVTHMRMIWDSNRASIQLATCFLSCDGRL
jgi:hypothetical protein